MLEYALPIWNDIPAKKIIGTAFIAENAAGTWFMITAAHVPTGQHASSNWIDWPAQVEVISQGSVQITFDLFVPMPVLPFPVQVPASLPRMPLFRWRTNPDGGSMADILALRLSDDVRKDGKFSPAHIIKLHEAKIPKNPAQLIYGFGFPFRNDGVWPYSPAEKFDGTLVSDFGNVITAHMPVESGFSGGPVFAADGRFLGMMYGQNGLAKIVSARVVAELVNGATEGQLSAAE